MATMPVVVVTSYAVLRWTGADLPEHGFSWTVLVLAVAVFFVGAVPEQVCWVLFPVYGSHYDPVLVGLGTAVVAGAVVALYGPATLTGRRAA